MSELADGYAQMLGRPVINRTGLSGLHNINFDMSPYAAEMAAIAEEAQKTNQVNLSDAASIMIPALQKQLGLTLEKRRETVDILVVDQAERMPTDN